MLLLALDTNSRRGIGISKGMRETDHSLKEELIANYVLLGAQIAKRTMMGKLQGILNGVRGPGHDICVNGPAVTW